MEVLVEKLKLSEVLKKPQTYLMVDFIIKLLLVAGKDTILVVCDRLSKINIWKLYRLPKSIMSNRGPQFVAELTKELNRMLDIEMKLLTSFYPQIDSQTKKMNQELEQYLRFFIYHKQKDWPDQLVTAKFAVNNKTYSTTKVFPFIVNYRRELRI